MEAPRALEGWVVEIIDEPTVTFRVMVVDDDREVSDLLKVTIERAKELQVCAIAHTPSGALERARSVGPDIVVLDYDLKAAMTGLDVAMELRQIVPDAHIVMFSAFLAEGESYEGVDAVHAKDKASGLTDALRHMVGVPTGVAGPTMPCANEACGTKIPLASVDIQNRLRTVTCDACGATRRWLVPA